MLNNSPLLYMLRYYLLLYHLHFLVYFAKQDFILYSFIC